VQLHQASYRARFASTVALALASLFVAVQADALPAAGATPAAGAPSPDTVKKATEAFTEGKALFEQKKFGLALPKFEASYSLVQSPNSHIFIARCLAETGRKREAYERFHRVIAEADARAATDKKYEKTRDSAKTEASDLATKLALITVVVENAEPASKLRVAGRPLTSTDPDWGKPLAFETAEPIVVELETPGRETVSKRVDLVVGVPQTVTLAVPAPVVAAAAPTEADAPSKPKKLRWLTYAIAGGGVGVVGMGVFAVAGSMSNGTYSELEGLCGNGPCPTNQNDLVDRGQTEQTIANVGAIVGAVGLAAGATIVTLDLLRFDGPDEDSEANATKLGLDAGPGWLGVHGSF
jgi:hypothetical protein